MGYTCEDCGAEHELEYDPQPYGHEKHDIDCLKCGNRMGTDSAFGVSIRLKTKGRKEQSWVRVSPR